MYKISIIVPIYKVEEHIQECLESIIEQLVDGIQIVCINDGTPDQSMCIAEKIVGQCSENVRKQFLFINQENKGLSEARNTGLNHAIGKYIGFLDSDDKLEPQYFSKLLDVINVGAYDIIDFNMITSEGIIIKTREDNDVNVFNSMKWYCPARLFASQLIINFRFTPGIYYEDLDLTPKLYIESCITFHINESLYWYRTNDEGITNSINKKDNLKTIQSLEFVFNKYLDLYLESGDTRYAIIALQCYYLLCINSCKRFSLKEAFYFIKKYNKSIRAIKISSFLPEYKLKDIKIKAFYKSPLTYISMYRLYSSLNRKC